MKSKTSEKLWSSAPQNRSKKQKRASVKVKKLLILLFSSADNPCGIYLGGLSSDKNNRVKPRRLFFHQPLILYCGKDKCRNAIAPVFAERNGQITELWKQG